MATLGFGNYDPVSANATTALNGSADFTIKCTSNSAYTIALAQGANPATGSSSAAPDRLMKDSGTNYATYDLFQDSARTVVWGDDAGAAPNTKAGTGILTEEV